MSEEIVGDISGDQQTEDNMGDVESNDEQAVTKKEAKQFIEGLKQFYMQSSDNCIEFIGKYEKMEDDLAA